MNEYSLWILFKNYLLPPRTDYVTWNGPNAALRKGAGTSVAKGPNPANVRGPAGRAAAAGPDPANRRGPQGLAKGSIYSSFKSELPARSN